MDRMTTRGGNRWRLGPAAVVIACLAAACGAPDANVVFEQLSDARRLAATITVAFTAGSEAANRAVMSVSDEQAVASAADARRRFAEARQAAQALVPVLQQLAYTEELRLLQQFDGQFAAYAALEDEILGLAVENTNSKARRLAFGPAQEAAAAMARELEDLAPARAGDVWHVGALAASAVSAVREIQVLEAPHIAESTDENMTNLERRMATAASTARRALEELRPRVAAGSLPRLDAATRDLEQFSRVHAEILTLSRRNTNVRSLALSLDRKRALQAPCDESLRALREALANRRHVGRRWP